MDKKLEYLFGDNFNLMTKMKRGIIFHFSHVLCSYHIHMHDFYEIEIVMEGGCGEYINGKYFEFSEGDIYVMTPNDIHNIILPKNGGKAEIFNIRFYKEHVTDNLRGCLDRITMPLIPRLEPEQYQFILSLASQAKDEMTSDSVLRQSAAEYLLCSILCMLLDMQNKFSAVMNKDQTRISLVLDYIARNYTRDISLDDAADEIAISKFYLSSILTANIGKGFSKILNIYRLRQVTNELLSTDKSITDICYDAGYQNFSHFSRVFKNRFGMTPSEYRNKWT